MTLDLNSLLIQLPLVILVIYIIELRDKRWQEMMRERDSQWQKFFEAQQVTHAEALATIAVSLGSMAEQTARTHELMQVHDTRVASAIPLMQKSQRRERGQDSSGT